MTPERWKQIEEIFFSAIDLPVEERAALLDRVCGDDRILRQEVERLLDNDEHASGFITHAQETADAAAATEQVGSEVPAEIEPSALHRRIGAYKLVREIGRGGMGAVYLAVRADNEFNRRVAIKIIKRGMDTDFIVRRFRNERQILAGFDHPNIARLLDGGTTDDGLPYFVMEFIEGLPIHRYCDAHRLTIKDRLNLFRQVCAAVQYAHDRQIIHRDIKPANILVTAPEGKEGGQPKLLDFGIAKILDPELVGDTLDSTMTALVLMTPDYASPEQARGERVTPASDQYSLGVLLYELLSGHRPYHVRNRMPHEIARIIEEQEPVPPSEIISRTAETTAADGQKIVTASPEIVSHNRGTTLNALRRDLAEGLDNVVMQALRKAPEHRYPSVQELSLDIDRYLQGMPVAAPAYVSVRDQTTLAEIASQPTRTIAIRPDTGSPATATGRFLAPSEKRSRPALLVAATVAAILAAMALFYFLQTRPTPTPIGTQYVVP
ncbi:MAG: serine/threonine protein kinase, partial [Blastocatellia bacterium]